MKFVKKYYTWLHGIWPAGKVEKLPQVDENGSTNLKDVKIVGDLTGVPLLKFASETGNQAVVEILKESNFAKQREKKTKDVKDLIIVGAGVSGVSAAMAAKNAKLDFMLIEATDVFNTIKNFPKKKRIFTYPTDKIPSGGIQYNENNSVKESLLKDMKMQLYKAGIDVFGGTVQKIKQKKDFVIINIAPENRQNKGEQIKALRCIIAIGRSGNFRKLGIPGEDNEKVSNRLHDPADYKNKNVVVIGGGDSAAEAAISLAEAGANVSMIYRGKQLNRPKSENIKKIDFLAKNERLKLFLNSKPSKITNAKITFMQGDKGVEKELANNFVFSLIGREAPLDFFRRSKIKIRTKKNITFWLSAAIIAIFITWLYHWKAGKLELLHPFLDKYINPNPTFIWEFFSKKVFGIISSKLHNPASILGTLRISASEPAFYYTLAYCLLVIIFGIKRIKFRKTSYVTKQTISLMLIQIFPLFLLPEIIFPILGHRGYFGKEKSMLIFKKEEIIQIKKLKNEKNPKQKLNKIYQKYGINLNKFKLDGVNKADDGEFNFMLELEKGFFYGQKYKNIKPNHLINELFPPCQYGHGREYWRTYGFILAWPLFIYNWLTDKPNFFWLIIGCFQTFVLIPFLIRRWGKGAYCGWICSCGALAETLGDKHRHKMPHGPGVNKLNIIGQIFLLFAFILLILRIITWILPQTQYNIITKTFNGLLEQIPIFNYKYFVDLIFAGIIGVSFYFHFSGRVWCRFACPLAALMHIYQRLFGRFRIFSDKKKCISCNICTNVCHQGIDIMNFANKGKNMADPQCVRCSACVQSCPTRVLNFGYLNQKNEQVLDKTPASQVEN